MFLDARIDLREGADRARDCAGRDFPARADEALLGASEFGIGGGELEPERGGLGMDAVRAADHRRQLVLERATLERGEEAIDIGDQEIGGAHELHVEAGVEHVGRRHALMHEARLGSHDLRKGGQKGDDVVLDLALDRVDARDIELGRLAFVPDFLCRRLRNDAELGHGVGRMRLDLEPDAEAGLRVPDRGHVRPGIARDHRRPSVIALGYEGTSRAVADRGCKLNSRGRLSPQWQPRIGKLPGGRALARVRHSSASFINNDIKEATMIRSSSVTAVAATLAAGLSAAQPAFAQDDVDQRFGTVHFATSCNDVAQRRFDRGMRYQHSFWYAQAKEIFEDVLKADPSCAIAYWGIALSLL